MSDQSVALIFPTARDASGSLPFIARSASLAQVKWTPEQLPRPRSGDSRERDPETRKGNETLTLSFKL